MIRIHKRTLLLVALLLLVVYGFWSYLTLDQSPPREPRARLVHSIRVDAHGLSG